MLTVENLSKQGILMHQSGLVELLCDSVNAGASVSFLAPLSPETALHYWEKIANDVASGDRIVLAALQAGHIVGSVQLLLAGPPNGAHRAEVQKLLVHTQQRGQGIAKKLLAELEQTALHHKRTLLVLDTQRGSLAEGLYERHGYTRAGIIPAYARNSDGTLDDTVVFYRQL